MSLSYAGEVIESRCDWFTATFANPANEAIARYRAAADIAIDKRDGMDPKFFCWRGYEGYTAGSTSWGERAGGSIVRVSGADADNALTKFAPLATNVSRLDLAVTIRAECPTTDVIRAAHAAAVAWQPTNGHKPEVQLLDNVPRGLTLSIGSRRSRFYARLYDKHAQSELEYYAGCLRFEVEAKRELGLTLAKELATSEDRRGYIKRLVQGSFRERGVPVHWSGDEPDLHVPPHRRRTDDLSRLIWFERDVMPALNRLALRGYAEQLRAVLATNPLLRVGGRTDEG